MTRPAARSNLVLLIVAAVAIAAVALSFLYRQQLQQADPQSAPTSTATGEMIGRMRPPFRLPDRLGLQHSVGEWDGRVVVLNFWASWCKPCRREIPAFIELQQTYAERGVQFVGLALDELSDVNGFIEELGVEINYPVLLGEGRGIEIATEYGNRFGVLPYTVIIGRDGRIAFVQYGELTRQRAEQLLLRLI